MLRISLPSLLLILMLAPPAHAANDSSSGISAEKAQQEAQEIYDNVMSPFCPGRTLSGCPSDKARDLREQIVVWLQEGKSQAEVKQMLLKQYGASLLGTPEKEGFGLMAWVLPCLFVIGGILIIALRVTRNPRVVEPENTNRKVSSAVDEDIQSQIQREVKEQLVK